MEVDQILFTDSEGTLNGGLLVDHQRVICGCCGSVFLATEVKIVRHLSWVNISSAIGGDEPYCEPDDDCDYEAGFDPYSGCYTDDC